MQFVAKGSDGQYYVCDGVVSRPVPASAVNDVLYLARTLGWAHGPVGAEWADGGYTRLGWNPEAFGSLPGDVDVAALAAELAGNATFAQTFAEAVTAKLGPIPRRFEATN